MANFSVDLEQIDVASQKLIDLRQRLNNLKADVDSVKLKGIMETRYSYRIEAALKQLSGKILDEAARMNSLGSALQYTVTQYRNAENAIMNSSADAAGSADNGRGTDKRSWWTRFWDWVTGKKADDYDTTTRAQEKAADASMRRQLWDILQDERYSEEYWDNATVDERKQILQEYMNAVIGIYGLHHVNTTIQWDTQRNDVYGFYRHSEHNVYLSERVLTDSISYADSYELIGTVAHELRHAYQHEAVDNPTEYMVSQETISAWRDNFRHYISNGSGYWTQPVESDARSFEVDRNRHY